LPNVASDGPYTLTSLLQRRDVNQRVASLYVNRLSLARTPGTDRRQRCGAHRRGDRAVAEVMLDRPGVVVSVVGQLVAVGAAACGYGRGTESRRFQFRGEDKRRPTFSAPTVTAS
jgi:hypothetical protein